MKSLRTLIAVTAVVGILAAAPVLAEQVTVGRFVMDLAKAKRLEAVDARSAAAALDRVGVRIPAGTDFSKRLTEGDVARLSRLAGLNVTTTNPDGSFDNDRLGSFFTVFASELATGSARSSTSTEGEESGPPFDPYAKGNGGSKGKKLGHRSPSDPE
jgi:hypothetical protein